MLFLPASCGRFLDSARASGGGDEVAARIEWLEKELALHAQFICVVAALRLPSKLDRA